MERYLAYRPVEDMPIQLAAAYANDGERGLEVRLVPRGGNRFLVLAFGRVPAFRVTLEECDLAGFTGEWERPTEHISCFTVQNSEWVTQFEKAELIHHKNPMHYVFLSDNQFVEVLAHRSPSVEWRVAG